MVISIHEQTTCRSLFVRLITRSLRCMYGVYAKCWMLNAGRHVCESKEKKRREKQGEKGKIVV